MKKILITGAAGFIGFHLVEALTKEKFIVFGLDNINDYYDVNLKYDRLSSLGISKNEASVFHNLVQSETKINFQFIRMNLENRELLPLFFEEHSFTYVVNLAAQAGVRYSLENPSSYIDSNIVGYANLLDCVKLNKVKHFIYASSSSVYGLNDDIPFSTDDHVDKPISLYAATKKSNELIAYTYSHLYKIPTTGLRFFTVYGPWGRPDMAMFLFTNAMVNNKPINVFNYGEMERDFTFISDIINGIILIITEDTSQRKELYKIYNIGNNKPVKIIDFISEIESNLEIKATLKMLSLQPGDVVRTWANVEGMINDYGYQPKIDIKKGVKSFIDWYKFYYKLRLTI